jgi:hypothetical protein
VDCFIPVSAIITLGDTLKVLLEERKEEKGKKENKMGCVFILKMLKLLHFKSFQKRKAPVLHLLNTSVM